MSDVTLTGPRRYRFGPLERRGVLAGWRAGQVLSVAASLVVAVGLLHVDSHLSGALVAAVAVGSGGFCATWPIGGRTVEQWLPIWARWVLGGGRPYASPAPLAGHLAETGGAIRAGALQKPPPALADCRLLTGEAPGGGTMGVVADARAGTYAAVLAASGRGFGLLEPEARDQQVAAWSALLAGLARDRCPIDRVQWVLRALPDSGESIRDHYARSRHLDPSSPASRSYEDLLSAESLTSLRQEVFVVARLNARRLTARRSNTRPADRRTNPRRPRAGHHGTRVAGVGRRESQGAACDELSRELGSLVSGLATAGIDVQGVLDPDSLEQVLSECTTGSPAGGPWPMGSQAGWGHFATDGLVHAVYWIAEWPRVEVTSDFLAPLLLQGGGRITVSVTMEPLETVAATRKVENARVSRAADEELRRRGGFASTARRRREDESLAVRETELADGHAPFRFSGFVGVTAENLDELAVACGAVEQAASRSFLALRRLYGDQEQAFTYLLPLARGLG